MALRDQPYLPLYVQDFLTDEKLMECGASATGVYIRLICVMHKSEEYGTVLLKQKDKQTVKQEKNFALKLARYMPYSVDEIAAGIFELVSEGVLIMEGDKLMQKRMVRDNVISNIRADAGKKGGIKTQSFAKAKSEANTESDIVTESDTVIAIKGGVGENELNISFDFFWNMYDKKIDRAKCEKKWVKLTDDEREECIYYLPAYIQATPDVQFRRNPETYLNNKSWQNDIVKHGTNKKDNGATAEQILAAVNEHFPIEGFPGKR